MSILLQCYPEKFYCSRIWFRFDSNRSLHEYTLQWICPIIEKDKEGMWTIHRVPIVEGQTFDRRLSTISLQILKRELLQWENFLFVIKQLMIHLYIVSTDSTLILIKAKGSVWHKSSMTNGVVPHSAGIDTLDAMWGGRIQPFKGLDICGYKLHLISKVLLVLLLLYL